MDKKEGRYLDSIFSPKLLEIYSIKEIEDYWKRIGENYEQSLEKRRFSFSHQKIKEIVANYIVQLGWITKYEVNFADFDSSYRFDIMAKKDDKTIVVEVKPDITTKDLGQTLGYVISVKKRYPEARVFLATDIFLLNYIFSEGEIQDIILDMSERYGLGIIFVSHDDVWVIPSEFIIS